jgi:hypothetical protein
VAAADSKRRAAPGNGRQTVTATEEERAGAAEERSCVLLINYRCATANKRSVFETYIIVKYDT